MRVVAALGLTALFLFVGAGRLPAASPDEVASDISDEIMSPYCPGITLHDCASEAAVKLRQRIVDKAAQGWSKERILTWLEVEWGAQIRATPTDDMWGRLAWLLPGIVAGGGLALVWYLLRRWNRRGARDRASDEPSVAPEDRRRLQRELARLRTER